MIRNIISLERLVSDVSDTIPFLITKDKSWSQNIDLKKKSFVDGIIIQEATLMNISFESTWQDYPQLLKQLLAIALLLIYSYRDIQISPLFSQKSK